VQYWEVFDGSMIREFEASVSAAINSLDISADGRHFVTGSNDCLVKVSSVLRCRDYVRIKCGYPMETLNKI